MKWRIDFSKESLEFLEKNNIEEDSIIEEIKLALRKLKGENININIKKLRGKWADFYRIRYGRLRIIAEFQFENCGVYIERIDWRGSVYK